MGLWQNLLNSWRLFHFDLRPAPYIEHMARGQSNKATLALMKSIEEEIAKRKRMQADHEEMLFAAADWRRA